MRRLAAENRRKGGLCLGAACLILHVASIGEERKRDRLRPIKRPARKVGQGGGAEKRRPANAAC